MNTRMICMGTGALTVILCCHYLAGNEVTTIPRTEPPMRFQLSIGESTIDVNADQRFELEVNGEMIAGTLKAYSTRRMETPEVVFEYPVGFGFEFLEGRNAQVWNLDGGRTDITVSRFETSDPPEIVAQTLYQGARKQLGERIIKEMDTSIALGGREIPGRRLIFAISEVQQVHDSFAFEAGEAVYHIVFLGSPPPGQPIETINASTIDIITRTFQFRDNDQQNLDENSKAQ